MFDKREALQEGFILDFQLQYVYTIKKEIGRGASGIVYDALYRDSLGLCHNARIKEFYPYEIQIVRKSDGKLDADADRDTYHAALQRFCDAYRMNIELRNQIGLANTTVDSVDLCRKNNTVYMIMRYEECSDYSGAVDENLRSVLCRLRTIVNAIKKYHENGYLHLDIKPENILVFPETAERVILFDFDSLIVKDALEDNREVCICFSDGFAAPEQVQGDVGLLSEQTDVYAIGALLFYKLFGRCPSLADCSICAKYDYTDLQYPDKRYSPMLFRKLDEFFRRTLAVSPDCRWSEMDELKRAIDDLLVLSEVDAVRLRDNFTYNEHCFIGRKDELQELNAMYEGSHVVFVHGIGGIGKTELVKRFVHENRDSFGTVVFASFGGSIMETVIGPEILLENFPRNEEEDDEEYFHRKMEALMSVAMEEDCIILDNFDIYSDRNLEQFLTCRCHFLITSREDFRAFNYTQLELSPLRSIEELLTLFRVYNRMAYDAKEKHKIEEIFELVDRHTMTVELIAKYLQESGESPIALEKKLRDSNGITLTGDWDVGSRKDKKLRIKSVPEHLLALFRLSDFTDRECEMMQSMSLLGYVRIRKQRFLELCNYEGAQKDLMRLIRRGWIFCEEDTGKIFLHQIVLDLVYNYLQPTSERCPAITVSMTQYAYRELESDTERAVRRRVLKQFYERITGEDDNYTEFLLAYYKVVEKDEQILQRIEEICKSKENERHISILFEVLLLRLKLSIRNAGLHEIYPEFPDYRHTITEKIPVIVDCAEALIEDGMREACQQAAAYRDLAKALDQAGDEYEIDMYGEAVYLPQIYDMEQRELANLEKILERYEFAPEEEIAYYQELLHFYRDDMRLGMYRSEHYGDSERILYYSGKIAQARAKLGDHDERYANVIIRDNGNVIKFFPTDISYEQCAQNEAIKGNHRKAIEYYQKAIEAGEWDAACFYPSIAKEYEELGEYEQAVFYLQKLLRLDEEIGLDLSDTYEMLIELYRILGDTDNVLICCDKAIEEQKKSLGSDVDGDRRNQILETLIWFYMAKYEASGRKNESLFEQCEAYHAQYEGIGIRISDFLCLKCERRLARGMIEDAATEILRAAGQYMKSGYQDQAGKMLELLLGADGRTYLWGQEIFLAEALCMQAEIYNRKSDYERERAALLEAEEIDLRLHSTNLYLTNCICRSMAECYWHLGEYDRAKDYRQRCDYYMLTERECEGSAPERQIVRWEDAARAYEMAEKYEEADRCYDRLFSLWEMEEDPYSLSSFDSHFNECSKRIWALIKAGRIDLAEWHNERIFRMTVENYRNNLGVEETESLQNCYMDRYMFELTEHYEKLEKPLCAAATCLVKIILLLDGTQLDETGWDNLCAAQEHLAWIIGRAVSLLGRIDIGDKAVDRIVETLQKMDEYRESLSSFPEVEEAAHRFLKKYEFKEIEFKH